MQEHIMRTRIQLSRRIRVTIAIAAGALALAAAQRLTTAQEARGGQRGGEPAAQAAATERGPVYDASGQLQLPADYRRWVLVGSSVGLTYAETSGGHQMFGTTLMEPTAHEHYLRTGTFREGTMLVLLMQGIGSGVMPSRAGQFASDIHVVEMAVKDGKRTPEGWAYYGFGGPMGGGYRTAASPQPKTSCYACHVEHAQTDNVFTQFYGLLADARGAR
jgi:hypothetical protein